MPEEHLIGLLDLHQLDAEYMCTEIQRHLSDASYSAENVVSQCYDGASVLSGVKVVCQHCCKRKESIYSLLQPSVALRGCTCHAGRTMCQKVF